jgi:hypothetical protein
MSRDIYSSSFLARACPEFAEGKRARGMVVPPEAGGFSAQLDGWGMSSEASAGFGPGGGDRGI